MRRTAVILALVATAYLATGFAQLAHMLEAHAGFHAAQATKATTPCTHCCLDSGRGTKAKAKPIEPPESPGPRPGRTPEKGCAACTLLATLHSDVTCLLGQPAFFTAIALDDRVEGAGIAGSIAVIDEARPRGPPCPRLRVV